MSRQYIEAPSRAEVVDLFWRSLWTFVSTALGATVVSSPLDLNALEVAVLAGAGAAVNVIAVFARQQLGTVRSR